MAAKRIGILTGGGDVPGLNSVIKTVVYRGDEIGCDVIGIRRGWDWTVMLIGAVLLAFAGLATYQLAHPHIPAS